VKPARLAARKPPARKKGTGQLQMRDMPLELLNEFTVEIGVEKGPG
jgi:hypothetical protein